MHVLLNIHFHRSQFPDACEAAVASSLSRKHLAAKLAYDGTRQTLAWLELHRKFSPAATAEGASVYEQAFEETAKLIGNEECHLVGLGVGGGWKEAALLRHLNVQDGSCRYCAMDVSAAMVITACEAALKARAGIELHPLVADLVEAEDTADVFAELDGFERGRRVLTCFGMLPGFEPSLMRNRLRSLARPDGLLLLSFNLAPGEDSRGGAESVLPQYDNESTRAWLAGSIESVGFKVNDGRLRFGVEESPEQPGLWRVAADFELLLERKVVVGPRTFAFEAGTTFRVLHSHRHTMAQAEDFIRSCGFEQAGCWTNASREEGVFLVRF